MTAAQRRPAASLPPTNADGTPAIRPPDGTPPLPSNALTIPLTTAPGLPSKRADGALTEILPPFGTNPPIGPVIATAPDLAERLIHNDPRELWYLGLPSKLSPRQVLQILYAALAGDVWQQWQLLSLMLDTWPMLRKCAHEVRQAVAQCKYVVTPWTAEEGDDPTQEALDKAEVVRRAMNSFKPDPMTDESGFTDMVYDIMDAILNGLCMEEIIWYRSTDNVILPRAAAWVHPRHFTYGNDGRLAVFDDMYNRLNFQLAYRPGQPPNPNKFLIPQFKTRSGSALGYGLVRPLAWSWSSMVFNREWMLAFAQKFGNPFLDASYKPGMDDGQMRDLEAFMRNAGAQGYCLHPEGSTLTVHPQQSLGPDNAHRAIWALADEQCCNLLLGQSGTTTKTPGKLGHDDTQEKVKREVVQGWASCVAKLLTSQFAAMVCRVNFGDDDECPQVGADFTEEIDPQAQAQRDQVFITGGVPMVAPEFYDRHGMKMPQPDDIVLVRGHLGVMADFTQQTVGEKVVPPQPGEGGKGDFGGGGEDQGGGGGDQDEPIQAVLARAPKEDFAELQGLVTAAKAAPHQNGEWEAVKVKIKHIKAMDKQSTRGGRRG